jgi:glyoxylase-like metal-dependent hydrolase (beta-lactamase superfamily II)
MTLLMRISTDDNRQLCYFHLKNMLFLLLIIVVGISARFDCPNSRYLPIRLPTSWRNGSSNCLEKSAREVDIEIFSVNNETFILRENKCINYEAPFMYLLFGNNQVLLIDTGATVSSISFPIQQHVETIIFRWCMKMNKQRKDIQLIVAHSHHHRDHTAGDQQFRNKPLTKIIGTHLNDVIRFFRLNNWPNTIGRYALDNHRHLAIIPIPGHEESSIAFYDCATGLLLTGDSFYPGRLYISNFSANVESISRLINFIRFNHLNITAILGTHIEMTQKSQIDYPMGATYQPNERQLNLSFEELEQLNNELQSQWKNGFNRRHKAYYDTFIVDPNSSELPLLPSNERRSNHSFILMLLDRVDYVWISYKPMFYTSLDFQLIFLATIDDFYFLSSMNTTQINHYWTIESYEISLNNLINRNLSSFQTKLYLGNYDKYLYDITINPIQPFLTIHQLNSSEIEPYHPLRYISYLSSNRTKSQIQLYLVHQIRVLPDFDALIHVIINPMNCTTNIKRNRLNHLLEQNGNEWAFHELNNHVSHRLTSASGRVRAQLLGDVYSTICTMQIIQEIQCNENKFDHYLLFFVFR